MKNKPTYEELEQRVRELEALTSVSYPRERFRHFFDLSLDLCCVANLKEGTLERVNNAYTELLGYAEEELLQTPFIELVHPEDAPKALSEIGQLLHGVPLVYYEGRMRHKNGAYRWFSWTASPVPGEGLTYAIGRDINSQKQAESMLRYHEEISANMAEGVYLIRASDGIIVYTNPKLERMFGYGSGEMIGQHVSMVNAPTQRSPEETAREIMEALSRDGEWHGEVKNIKKDGTVFWCAANVSIFEHSQYGEVMLSIHTDITQRKYVEEELRTAHRTMERRVEERTIELIAANARLQEEILERSIVQQKLEENETRYRELFDNMSSGVIICQVGNSGDDLRIIDLNRQAERISSITRDQVVGRDVLRLAPGIRTSGLLDRIQQVWRTGEPEYHPVFLYRDERVDLWIETSIYRLPSQEVVVIYNDITRRVTAEEALRESEELHRILLANISDAVFLTDDSGTLLYVCPNVQNIFRYSRDEVIMLEHISRVLGDDLFNHADLVDKQEIVNIERDILDSSGHLHSLLVNVKRVAIGDSTILYTCRDITERKDAEKEIRQYAETQRVLLREVNHRVKNNLTAIIGMVQQQKARPEVINNAPCRQALKGLTGKIEGLAMVHSLLTASGWQPLLLSDLCAQVIAGTVKGIADDDGITVDVQPSTARVTGTQANHLTLVLNELVTNSVKHAGDAVHIAVEIKHEDEMVQLIYRDDGSGYPQEIIAGDYPEGALGMEIIRGIAGKSLAGELRLKNDQGAIAMLSFAPGS